jgi:hypothetical protein
MALPHRSITRIRKPRAAAVVSLVVVALICAVAAVVFAAPAGALPKGAVPPVRPAAKAPAATTTQVATTPAATTPGAAAPGAAATAAALPRAESTSAREAREARQRLIAEHKALEAQRALEHHEAAVRALAVRHEAGVAREAEAQARHQRENAAIAQRKVAHQEAIVAQRAADRAALARKREGRGAGSPAGAGSGSVVPTAHSSAVVAAPPAPAAPVVAPAPAPAAPTPAVTHHHGRVAGHRHARAHRHGARRGLATAGALARPAVGSGSAGSAPTPAKARKTAAVVHHPATSAPTAIVNTVTKIIDVVPPLLRVLIAVLAALALALGIASRVSVLRARRLARQRRELLEDVGLLQAALLPELPPRIGPVATSAAYRPASGPAAGGDFFDVFALEDGRLGVIVGDVSGHGRHALPHTTIVRFTLRTYLEAGAQPAAALQAAAPALERQLGESFATVAVATYEPGRRLLRYACAGHPAPLIIGSSIPTHLSVCSAPPVGIGETTGTRETTVQVPGAATICFYTDGVVEARTRGGLYGHDRLVATLEALGASASATELLDRVACEADHHPDDMAACILHISGSDAAPVVERERLELDREAASRPRPRRLLVSAGVSEAAADSAMASARALLREHGRVVLEVGDMDSRASVQVWPQNVSMLPATSRRSQGAAEGTG